MNNNTFLSVSLILLTLLLAGCGSSPNAKLYILNAINTDNLVPAITAKGRNIVVKVGPVSIADTLDKAQIITRSAPNMLVADEFNRWSGHLQSDIQRVIAENIAILLPTKQVILSQEIALLPVDFQVLVNIRKFDGVLGGMITLKADWTVAAKVKEKTIVSKRSVLQQNADGADYQAYVATQSQLLEKLSQEMTDELRKLYLK